MDPISLLISVGTASFVGTAVLMFLIDDYVKTEVFIERSLKFSEEVRRTIGRSKVVGAQARKTVEETRKVLDHIRKRREERQRAMDELDEEEWKKPMEVEHDEYSVVDDIEDSMSLSSTCVSLQETDEESVDDADSVSLISFSLEDDDSVPLSSTCYSFHGSDEESDDDQSDDKQLIE